MPKSSKSTIGRLFVLPVAVSMAALSAVASQAQVPGQGLQNWTNNQASNIQQDANNGFLSQGQANRLESKDAQIQNQEQQWLQQNGGHLTNGEKHKLSHELQNVQHSTMWDATRDGHPPAGYPYQGMQQAAPSWAGGAYYPHPDFNPNNMNPNMVNPNMINQGMINPNAINPNMVNPNMVNANGLPVNAQNFNGQNSFHHHHHQGLVQFVQNGGQYGQGQYGQGQFGQGQYGQSNGQGFAQKVEQFFGNNGH